MVHGAGEVLVEHQWNTSRLAKPAVGEANAVRMHELRWRGLVTVLGHWDCLCRWRSSRTCEAVESGRHPDAAKPARRAPWEDRLLTGRGPNLRARTGSVSGVTAIDVEDMAGDE
jgi:hypothetical protein